MGMPDLMQHRP